MEEVEMEAEEEMEAGESGRSPISSPRTPTTPRESPMVGSEDRRMAICLDGEAQTRAFVAMVGDPHGITDYTALLPPPNADRMLLLVASGTRVNWTGLVSPDKVFGIARKEDAWRLCVWVPRGTICNGELVSEWRLAHFPQDTAAVQHVNVACNDRWIVLASNDSPGVITVVGVQITDSATTPIRVPIPASAWQTVRPLSLTVHQDSVFLVFVRTDREIDVDEHEICVAFVDLGVRGQLVNVLENSPAVDGTWTVAISHGRPWVVQMREFSVINTWVVDGHIFEGPSMDLPAVQGTDMLTVLEAASKEVGQATGNTVDECLVMGTPTLIDPATAIVGAVVYAGGSLEPMSCSLLCDLTAAPPASVITHVFPSASPTEVLSDGAHICYTQTDADTPSATVITIDLRNYAMGAPIHGTTIADVPSPISRMRGLVRTANAMPVALATMPYIRLASPPLLVRWPLPIPITRPRAFLSTAVEGKAYVISVDDPPPVVTGVRRLLSAVQLEPLTDTGEYLRSAVLYLNAARDTFVGMVETAPGSWRLCEWDMRGHCVTSTNTHKFETNPHGPLSIKVDWSEHVIVVATRLSPVAPVELRVVDPDSIGYRVSEAFSLGACHLYHLRVGRKGIYCVIGPDSGEFATAISTKPVTGRASTIAIDYGTVVPIRTEDVGISETLGIVLMQIFVRVPSVGIVDKLGIVYMATGKCVIVQDFGHGRNRGFVMAGDLGIVATAIKPGSDNPHLELVPCRSLVERVPQYVDVGTPALHYSVDRDGSAVMCTAWYGRLDFQVAVSDLHTNITYRTRGITSLKDVYNATTNTVDRIPQFRRSVFELGRR
jgi:hypothetical protein